MLCHDKFWGFEYRTESVSLIWEMGLPQLQIEWLVS